MTIDSRVTGLNQDVFQTLQKIKNPKQMSEAEARALRSSITKDNKIDENEKDLLLELTQDKNQIVQVSAAGVPAKTVGYAPAKGPARQVLETLTKPSDLNKLWDGSKEDFAKLMDLYGNVPGADMAIQNLAAGKLLQGWAQSNMFNGYAPLRKVIGDAYDKLQSSDPATKAKGQKMIHDLMERIDTKVGGVVPDFLYGWLKPEPVKA